MGDIKIVLTKYVKDELVELGIYELWLKYTDDVFNKEKDYTVSKKLTQKRIQKAIDNKNIKDLISMTYQWGGNKDQGYDWWLSIYNKYDIKKTKSRI